ncbi:uncharacterized protein LOC117529461 [Thalassophryne amazonica]|uniref:uncharacterized protein LOC117529461 n=1 Tax=Thalassophryne amazonica TaxID=390379 RepID=UPI0014725950|nr:uncharacterized protein LOC117529461 [Thalassophryne amazonica]XP_034048147.1 uncharacterized protein LOC117529461 [Thalassophryne amazonica]
MDGLGQPPTPHPPKTCSSPNERPCWSVDVRVAVLLVMLAGAVILLLLYRLLQLRHRLRLALAGHALEYHSFYHAATYTLKHLEPPQDLPNKNGIALDAALPVQTVTTDTPATITPLPPPAPPPSPPMTLPPPPVLAPPPQALPMPIIHTTPPSPHLSWGACSDVDVYSRIGAFRSSRLSSLSSQSKVILFEHSSL